LKKKQGKEKPDMTRLTRRVDPAKPGQKPGCNPLTFVFLLKRRRVDFFKKKMSRATGSKPKTRALDRDRSKNYDIKEVRLTSTLLQASSV
jgi:hypothetical protein